MAEQKMTFQEAYGVYIDMFGPAIRAVFGCEPALVNTGGGCMAIELVLENGWTVWVTDAGDILSPFPWRSDPAMANESFGYGALVWDANSDEPHEHIGGSLDYDAPDTPAAVVAVITAAIDDARNNGQNLYGDGGYSGDRIARGLDA
jgi:hypothetical protein